MKFYVSNMKLSSFHFYIHGEGGGREGRSDCHPLTIQHIITEWNAGTCMINFKL